jgi:TetR/AcrR family transcriptional regulator of autoinduction and epiphytic fitness
MGAAIRAAISADKVDGRRARGERARAAVVDAILDLLQEGDLRPTAERVAARAGVSLRLVFHHFADIESLYAAAADRQTERLAALFKPISPEGQFDARLEAFVQQRARMWERIAPVRRASLLLEPFSGEIRRRLAAARTLARREAARVFAHEIARVRADLRDDIVEALGAASSWQTWETLRRHQGLSIERSRRTVATIVRALLEP